MHSRFRPGQGVPQSRPAWIGGSQKRPEPGADGFRDMPAPGESPMTLTLNVRRSAKFFEVQHAYQNQGAISSAVRRAGGRLSRSISTRPTRSVSADGCRKSGWLTTASCRLSDGRVQSVWSVTVYVRSVLIISTVGLSKRCTRFRCPSILTRSSACARERTGRAVRQEELDREREPLEVLREVTRLHYDAVRSLQE